MRSRFFILAWAFFSSCAFGRTLTLTKVFQQAKSFNAQVRSQALAVQIAEERHDQAWGSFLPSLDVTSRHLTRDPVELAGGLGNFGRSYEHNAQLTLSQPLFQGGAEYSLLDAASREVDIARARLRATELSLYQEVGESFHGLLLAQRELELLEEQQNTLERREKVLGHRVRIGQSARSDLFAAQARLARTRADILFAKSSAVQFEQSLSLLTGIREFSGLTDPAELSSLKIVPEWEKKLDAHPRLEELRMQRSQSEELLSATRGDFFPKVSVEANYYLARTGGVLQSSQWDVTLLLSLNLFEGGRTASRGREAKARLLQVEARLSEEQKNLRRRWDLNREAFLLQKQQVESMRIAVDFAEKNYHEQEREYRTGLVSNLEVLRALDELIAAKRELVQSEYRARLAWLRLKVTAGIQP